MRSAQRTQIVEFLRREYGIQHVRAERGAKHLKLTWAYQGREFSHGCSYGSHRGEYRAMANMRAQIRRMMGRPEKEQTMSTIEVIADAADSSASASASQEAPREARVWEVKVCAYRAAPAARPQLALEFPADVRTTIPVFTVDQIDDEHWRIRSGGVKKWSVTPAGVRTTVAADCDPFRPVIVEAVDVDGEVLIHVPLAIRQEPARRAPSRVATVRKMPTLMPEAASSLEYRMRALLQDVREIEEASPYRFTRRPDGGLFWRAPTIE